MIFAFYYEKENPTLCSSGSDTSAPISLKKKQKQKHHLGFLKNNTITPPK